MQGSVGALWSGKTIVGAMFAVALLVAPDGTFFADLDLGTGAALAKGGNGGGNGNGGGGGGGNGGAGGNSGGKSGDAGAASGKSASAPGHDKSETGTARAALGSLNASHASSTARANASPNSRVGGLAAYEAALAAGDLEEAAQALGRTANKAVTPDVVAEVNRNLGVEATPEEEAQMADLAEAARAGEPVGSDEPGEEEAAEGESGDTPAEEENEVASAADELMGVDTAQ